MAFNYYYGSQAEQFSFVRIPRIMLTDKAFQSLSITSKVLYGVLLDRMSLSMKNNWFDEENRVYIIYQIGEIMEDLGLTKKKAMDLLQELEAFGLLEKKRRGHGLPNILYVKNFMPEPGSRGAQTGTSVSESEPDHSEGQAEKESFFAGSGNDRIRPAASPVGQDHSRGSENGTSDRFGQHSRSDGFGTQEVPKMEPLEVQDSAPLRNQTNNNYTYRNQTESNLILSADRLRRYDEMRSDAAPDDVVSAYRQLIRENVDYDSLIIVHPYERELIDGMICRSWQCTGKEPETRGEICMKKKHYANRNHVLLRIVGRILIALIGVIQAAGTLFVGISAVVLKPVAILMIAAATLLAILAQFPWKDAIPVFAVATVAFWLPEIAALFLVALTVIQGKIAGEL